MFYTFYSLWWIERLKLFCVQYAYIMFNLNTLNKNTSQIDQYVRRDGHLRLNIINWLHKLVNL